MKQVRFTVVRATQSSISNSAIIKAISDRLRILGIHPVVLPSDITAVSNGDTFLTLDVEDDEADLIFRDATFWENLFPNRALEVCILPDKAIDLETFLQKIADAFTIHFKEDPIFTPYMIYTIMLCTIHLKLQPLQPKSYDPKEPGFDDLHDYGMWLLGHTLGSQCWGALCSSADADHEACWDMEVAIKELLIPEMIKETDKMMPLLFS